MSAGSWQAATNPPGLHPLGVGTWRAPAGLTNTFARESHMDILAARAGADPVEFRLRNLSDKRMRRVLETAAERFAWKPAKAPSGRGVGVSCGIYSGTYMATMAEVSVDRKTGRVKVKRIVFVHDQGPTVSPEGTRQQIEGAIIMGLGYALTEEVRFQSGEVLSRNFDTYEIPRYLLAAEDRNGADRQPGGAGFGVRRTSRHQHGRRGGQRDFRRGGRPAAAVAHDSGARAGGSEETGLRSARLIAALLPGRLGKYH